MLIDSLIVGKKLLFHSDYKQMCRSIEFWEEAVEVSSDYWNVKDPQGEQSLKPFTCEDKSDFKWRKSVSTPKNYMGSILTKYVSTSFKNKPVRSDNEFFNNVDMLGSSMGEFMEYAAKQALIQGVSYIVPDSTATDSSLSELQKSIMGIRPFLRLVEAKDAINWIDYLGHLQEIIIRFEDINDQEYYIYYNNEVMMRIDVNDNQTIVAISPAVSHGFKKIPVVRMMPFDTEESFVASGANMQLSINNLSSLEKVEIYKSTFTRYFAKGFPLNRDEEGNPLPMSWGNERIIHAESPDGDMKPLGADVGQADSIRKSMSDETQSLFQQYHLSASQIQEGTAIPSGYSLVISRADFNSVCNSIVKETERAENEMIALLATAEGLVADPTVYSREFIEPDKQEAITNLRETLALDIPQDIKDQEIDGFRTKFYTNKVI